MRKLAVAALSYAAGTVLAHYLFPLSWLLPCAVACLPLVLVSLLALRGAWRLRGALVFASMAAALAWSWVYAQFTLVPAEELVGETHSVTAEVTDYSFHSEDYSRVYARLTTDGLPRVKIAIYEYDGELPALSPGDEISLDVRLTSAVYRSGTETDNYISRGIYLIGYADGAVEVTGRSALAFLYFPKAIAAALSASIGECFPAEAAAFMKALLVGERTQLYDYEGLYSALGTSGLMHVVSVSGLHVSFLLGFVRLFTGKKRLTALIGIPLLLVFIPMTGASPSVIRASFMQAALIFAPLLKRENDSITSLAAILAVLLIVNPNAAASISLQLSFAAMAGLLLVSGRIQAFLLAGAEKLKLTKIKRLDGAVRFVVSSVSSSVGAMVFSTPLVAIHFGYVSLYAALTNLLCLWAMSILFLFGFVVALVGLVLPALGRILSVPAVVVFWYVRAVVLWVASLPNAAVYTVNPLIGVWLALSYGIFALTLLRPGKRGFRLLMPLCLCLCALSGALLITRISVDTAGGTIAVVDVGQGQCVAVFIGTETVVIDCGNTGTMDNAGDIAANYLLGYGRGQVDALVLTHLHADHADGVTRLMQRMRVERLVLPLLDEKDDEDGLLPAILATAEEKGTEVFFVETDTALTVGELSATLYAPLGGTGTNERGLIFLGDLAGYRFLVMGDASEDTERMLLGHTDLPELDLLVVGHHGSKYSTSYALLSATNPDTAVISSGYNTYGHPTTQTLTRLGEYGCGIYRTDLSGTVRIQLD